MKTSVIALVASLADELALERFWQMVAYASRYGHQPILPMLGQMTADRLRSFCEAVHELVKKENESGASISNRSAEGG